ncbi:hypothetical protein H4Q26_017758 [Puccinia striiformis f. sp. tritici PST-130]|nr:hypothetical protein H4Q26_017758 [Puccinia striiformis f. sp. tritici PST-130]
MIGCNTNHALVYGSPGPPPVAPAIDFAVGFGPTVRACHDAGFTSHIGILKLIQQPPPAAPPVAHIPKILRVVYPSDRNKAAKLGYCLRAITPKDRNDPRFSFDLKDNNWFLALAKPTGPHPAEFTCADAIVAYGKTEKYYCCPPLPDTKCASTFTINMFCYARDEPRWKPKGRGGNGGKGGNGGQGGNGGKGGHGGKGGNGEKGYHGDPNYSRARFFGPHNSNHAWSYIGIHN